MNNIKFATNNEIILDGKATGFGVAQTATGTEVIKAGVALQMPANRYNLTTDEFLSAGVAGLTQFETDFRAAVSR